MLTTNIALAEKYDYLSDKFKKAFTFLRETDLASLPIGRTEIDGDEVYASVQSYTTMTVEECAQHIINRIKPYHQQGIEIIGDKTQIIHRLGIGTGACTDVFEMYEEGADACLVSDDGVNNWIGVQWAVDHDIPLIVINHMTCEVPGMEHMSEYLSKQFPEVSFTFVSNDYGIYHMDK